MRSPRRTSTLTALLALSLPGLALVAGGPAGPAGAAPPECQGQSATIVAVTDRQQLQGTEGADVISTAGFTNVTVRAGGGDDLVCATGRHDSAQIYGDEGDDTLVDVDVRGKRTNYDKDTELFAGPGSDHFIANRDTWIIYKRAAASVSIDAAGTVVDGSDTDTFVGSPKIQGTRFSDTYVGTPGNDRYVSGDQWNERNDPDIITTGAGDDSVWAFRGSVSLGPGDDFARVSGGTVTGGEGRDDISLRRGGTASGGPGADRLETSSYPSAEIEESRYRLSGGPGNDVLTAPYAWNSDRNGCPRFCARGSLEGGPGMDTLDLNQRRSVVDLAAGRVRVQGGVSKIGFFERVLGSHYDDVIRGDARRNRFEGTRGADVLVGRGGADVLIGGRGRDRAVGGAGRDRCEAEARRSC
jgi:Ca2+-binding RTX toxin-like protein